jgi:16S rRNA (guanine527-N7)-methyltransferase
MSHIHAGREMFLQEMEALRVDVSRETRDQLEAMVLTLARWQKTINLVGRATLDEIWVRHVLDSAQLIPLLPKTTKTLVDLGSGAGFPGLVLAALKPGLSVTLVEADARKAAYLGEAGRRMQLANPPTVRIGRIEALKSLEAEVVTARALAPLDRLLGLAHPHLAPGGICLFHKGAGWQAELKAAMKDWEISQQSFSSVTDRDAVLLRIGPFSAKTVRDR